MGLALKSVIVTITDEAMDRIEEVAGKLKSKGLLIDRVLPRVGTISGKAKNPNALEKVRGVMSVEEEYTSELPPAGADVQ